MTFTFNNELFKTLIFKSSCFFASLLLLAMAFEWSLIDAYTPFLALPMIGITWLMLFFVSLWTIIFAYKQRKSGLSAFIPLAICIGAFLLAAFFPFTKLWLNANFYLKKSEREVVIAQVVSRQLQPNVTQNSSLIKLSTTSNLSTGGNEIIVREYNKKPYVFFFTYRGILDSYSGFLWVPEGGRVELFQKENLQNTKISPFGNNWFFLGRN